MSIDKNIDEPVIKKRRISAVWITPFLAAVITIWLVVSGLVNSGIYINIQFENGNDLEPGKTLVKYRGITIGVVEKLTIGDNPKKIIAVVKLIKEAKPIARLGSSFWIVKPRLSLNEVSGLNTIISGSYIEAKPAVLDKEKLLELPEQFDFSGLEQPPANLEDGGLHISLATEMNSGIPVGTPVFYNKMQAGYVYSKNIDTKEQNTILSVLINKEFEHLVNNDSNFWEMSGMSLDTSASGINLNIPPLTAVFQGGIAFDSPEDGKALNSQNKQIFMLYSSETQTKLSKEEISLYFEDSKGITSGKTPVLLRGITIGLVTDIFMGEDNKNVIGIVRLKKEYKHLATKNSVFRLVYPRLSIKGVDGLETILSGAYLELIPGDGDYTDKFYVQVGEVADKRISGVQFMLSSEDKGSLDIGSPVNFRGLKIGHIESLELKSNKVVFHGIIYNKFDHLLSPYSYFTESGGMDISVTSGGINMETPSVETLLSGGVNLINFYPVKNKGVKKSAYNIFPNRNNAFENWVKRSGGLVLDIETEGADGIKEGSPVLFKHLKVGFIEKIELKADGQKINIQALIYPKYKNLVGKNSVFWNCSGVKINLGAEGLSVQTGTITSVTSGAIEFSTPETENIEPTEKGQIFKLYEDFNSAKRQLASSKAGLWLKLVSKADKPQAVGTPVYYKGLKAGEINGTRYDSDKSEVVSDVLIYPEFEKLVNCSSRFYISSGINISADADGFNIKTKSLMSMAAGSIDFDTFGECKPLQNKDFILYKDRFEAKSAEDIKVQITFAGGGIKENASVEYSNTNIGRVIKSEFIPSENATIVTALIDKDARSLLTKNTKFWLSRGSISIKGVEDAKALITGAVIKIKPIKGEFADNFIGENFPPSPYCDEEGLRITLKSPLKYSLEPKSPVLYRQIQVGGVENVRLGNSADEVLIDIFIEQKYAALVRENSRFWNAGGIGAKINLFGIKVKTESVKTIVSGGISFATPDNFGKISSDGKVFELYETPNENWLDWKPKINIR